MMRLISLKQLTPEQKRFLLAYDRGVLTRVARQVQATPTAVHLVFAGKTKYSPIIDAALTNELRATLRRLKRDNPAAAAFPAAAGN